MKRRRPIPPLAFVAAFLVLLLNAPDAVSESVRCRSVTIASPFWSAVGMVSWDNLTGKRKLKEQIASLEEENEQLKSALEAQSEEDTNPLSEGIAAKVICRSPELWHHYLWIGTADPSSIKKNCPVTASGNLVGIVDLVGTSVSRVRLITHPKLCPSVRCARGDITSLRTLETARKLMESLLVQEPSSPLIPLLALKLKEETNLSGTLMLAKGTLEGATDPSWRRGGVTLQGSGFNYDFADSFGPSRDLRTGQSSPDDKGLPLVLPGDLLVTTGFDGLFPAGIPVAVVKTIAPLGEGDFFYSLTATASVGNLDHLTKVTVWPPLQ